MKTIKFLSFSALLLLIFSCQTDSITEDALIIEKRSQVKALSKLDKNRIVITTNKLDFEAPDYLPSGWTTFEYVNKSHHPHFFIFDKMPEGYDVNNSINEVVPAFQEGMYAIMNGDWNSALAAFGKLPTWYSDVKIVGGPGMLSPYQSAITSLYLEPGTYVIECYVKFPDGTFHTSVGMIDQIIVTDEKNYNTPPKADTEITISSTNGIELPNKIKPGLRTFSVHFKDQIAHENFLGHDVNLVELSEDADLDALNAWMDWSAPKGLTGHGVKGVTFIGGTQEAPAGNTTYFTAFLKPKKTYALVSEITNPMSKGMLKVFTVPSK